VQDLKEASVKAWGLAQKIVYYCKETIGYFLGKANAEGESLGKFQVKEEVKAEEKKPEESTKQEITDTQKEKQDNIDKKLEDINEKKETQNKSKEEKENES